MDKYQEKLLKNMEMFLQVGDYSTCPEIVNGKLIFKQCKDYTLNDYVMEIKNANIDYIEVIADKETKYKSIDGEINVPFKFDNIIKKMKFHFVNDLADVYEVCVDYKYADKQEWDQEAEEIRQNNLKKELNLVCRTGLNLVNIHWQNVSTDVEKTNIKIYAVVSDKEMLMLEKTVEGSVIFFVLDKLAYGKYFVKINQLDKKDKTIIEDSCKFFISDQIGNIGDRLKESLESVKNQVSADRNTVVIK